MSPQSFPAGDINKLQVTKSKAPLTLRNPDMIQQEVEDGSATSIPVRDDEQEFFSEGQNQTMYDRYPGSQDMHYQVAQNIAISNS